MIDIPNPNNIEKYRQEEPRDEVKIAVTAAWQLIFPEDETFEPDYDAAYTITFGGYMAGHPEAASNLGLLIIKRVLSEKVLRYAVGHHAYQDVAEAWFLRAIEGKHHSPQAEIQMALLIAARPFTADTESLTSSYLTKAVEIANNPESLWADDKESWLIAIDSVKTEINNYLLGVKGKKKLH